MSMLEMRGVILSVSGNNAEISPLNGGGCGQCSSKNGCGSEKLSKVFCGSEPRKFVVSNMLGAKVGDEVVVALEDGGLLRSVLLMYMLPLFTMMAGGFIGSSVAGNLVTRDIWSAAAAMAGLLIGFFLVKIFPERQSQVVVQSISSPS
ncbi:MAG: SoxR reducing system RseC family protein [Sideroxydans sp.]|nr:SoxR reducing system RseC family protein [Sideroxydans sp.]